MNLKKGSYFIKGGENNCNYQRKDKFKLVSCPVNGKFCTDILPAINALYAESEYEHANKKFQKSIDKLEQAYNKSLELKESPCANCVAFFQSNITGTLESMQKELHGMSRGFFNSKRYNQAHNKLTSVLMNMDLFRSKEYYTLSVQEITHPL